MQQQPTKFYFTFESQQFYAQFNASGHIGVMLFTGAGMPVEKYQHPELWEFYRNRKNAPDLIKTEIF